MSCPDDDTLLRFAQGHASEAEQAQVAEHLGGCDDCRRALADAARLLYPDPPPEAAAPEAAALPLPAGTRVSRYEVMEVVGLGGAGVVYRARDPELQRDVALKLIRPDAAPSGSRGGAQARLLEEARAMARLSHPNVVNVYDAGTYEGDVFVVMELVQGATLAEWLHREKRAWQDVLELFVKAGRGLAAAHAAGIVHRDFKPENVLVGREPAPRVRVTDFGLARQVDAPEAAALAGTPAYMAPEQLRGQAVDARTDQFSFCVSLYLALYGRHPFGIRLRRDVSVLELVQPVLAGRIEPAPEGTDVPAGVRPILVRGLAVAPDDRHPSMEALLADLDRWRRPRAPAPSPPRRRALAAAVACVLLGAVLLAGSRRGRDWLSRLTGRCGNGVVEPGEECDDGNGSDADACLGTCRFATCGDGKVRAHVEECDDGNQRDGDGCSASCLRCATGGRALAWHDNGHCYSRIDGAATWREARELCRQRGGDLATVTTTAEAFAIHATLVAPAPARLWIGVSGAGADGALAWVTGEPNTRRTAEPGFGTLDEDVAAASPPPARCGQLALGKLPRGYLPVHLVRAGCDETAPALCEQPAWTIDHQSNHAYVLVSQPASWSAAKADCAARGAHLVTLASAAEQAFVATLTFGAFWVGATDAEQEGTFRWVTGEPLGFMSFAAGEPDDGPGGAADCVVVGNDRMWHDRRCNEPQPHVCEVD